jgi:hypothetical protein
LESLRAESKREIETVRAQCKNLMRELEEQAAEMEVLRSGMGSSGGGKGGGGKSFNLNTKAGQNAAFNQILSDTAAVMDLLDEAMGVKRGGAFDVGSFRLGEAKSMQQYNITVNGAIDSESTARQIVEILNDSSARGTLGAGAFDK